MAGDPNRKCVCGFWEFNEKSDSTLATVQRWLRYASYPAGGLGSSPLGITLGIGDPLGAYTTWAQVNTQVTETLQTTYCKACKRIRAQKLYFGMGVLGAYIDGSYVYVVVTDTVDAANNYLSYRGPTTIEQPLEVSPSVPLPLMVGGVITTSLDTPPRELRADTALRALLPVPAGVYDIYLANRRDGTEHFIGTVSI